MTDFLQSNEKWQGGSGRHSTKPLEVLKDENLSSGAFYFFLLTLLILRIFVCTKELWQVEEKCLNSDKTCTSELTLSMGLSWCGYAGIFLKIHWMKSIWLLDSEYQYKTILLGPWNKFWCLHFPQRKLVLTFFCSQVIALSGIDNLHTQGWRRWNIKRCVCAANVNK